MAHDKLEQLGNYLERVRSLYTESSPQRLLVSLLMGAARGAGAAGGLLEELRPPEWLLEELGPKRTRLLLLAALKGRLALACNYLIVYRLKDCRRRLIRDLRAGAQHGPSSSIVYSLLEYSASGILLGSSGRYASVHPRLLRDVPRIRSIIDKINSIGWSRADDGGRKPPPLLIAGVNPSTGRVFLAAPPLASCLALAVWSLWRKPLPPMRLTCMRNPLRDNSPPDWLVREMLGFDLNPGEKPPEEAPKTADQCPVLAPISGPRVRVQGDLVLETHCNSPGRGDTVKAAAELVAGAEAAERLGYEILRLEIEAVLSAADSLGQGSPEARLSQAILDRIDGALPGLSRLLRVITSRDEEDVRFLLLERGGEAPRIVLLEDNDAGRLFMVLRGAPENIGGPETQRATSVIMGLLSSYESSGERLSGVTLPPIPLEAPGGPFWVQLAAVDLNKAAAAAVIAASRGAWPASRPPERVRGILGKWLGRAGPRDVRAEIWGYRLSFHGGILRGRAVDSLYAAGRLASAALLIDKDAARQLYDIRKPKEFLSALTFDRSSVEALARALARIASARSGVALAWSEGPVTIEHPEHGEASYEPGGPFWVTSLSWSRL